MGCARHAAQGAGPPDEPPCAGQAGFGPGRVRTGLDVALVARLQAGDLSGQPRAHAAPRVLQPPAPAPGHRRPEAGIRPQRRLHGAAALRKRPRAHTPRPAGAARRGGEVPRDRPGRGAQGRTRAESGHRLCRRHPPAGRRSRQLPAVCAAAEGRSPPAGCCLRVQHQRGPRLGRPEADPDRRRRGSAPHLRRRGDVRWTRSG